MTESISAEITVSGHVEGSIVVGKNNLVVGVNNGTIVHNTVVEAPQPVVKRRDALPAPPRKPRGFIGRKNEIARLENWLSSDAPVLIQGEDGMGKFSLAKLAANGSILSKIKDGVLFLEGGNDKGDFLSLEDLAQKMFDALYLSEPRQKVDLEIARTYLSGIRPLVFLNQISLSPSDLDKLINLFGEVPIMISSDMPLRSDQYETLVLSSLALDDSLALLAARTGRNETEIFAEMAALLNNLPAALVMVANSISNDRITAPEALARLKSYRPSAADKNKAALEASFALILSVAGEDELDMLLQTAAGPGISVDRAWLESVCGGKKVSASLEALGVLQTNSPRFRLMPGLREILLKDSRIEKFRLRLLEHLLAELKERWKDFDFVKAEFGNLLGFLEWAVVEKNWSAAIALGRALDPYLTLNGLWGSWQLVLTRLQTSAVAANDLVLKGWVLHQLGTREFCVGNAAAAKDLLEQALSIRQSLGDADGAAATQHNLDVVKAGGRVEKPKSAKPVNPIPLAASAVVLLAAIAFFLFRPAPAVPTVIQTPSPTVAIAVLTDTLTPNPTSTDTPVPATPTWTPIPSATLTATELPTATAIPTYIITQAEVIAENVNCRYGPGPYISVTNLLKKNIVTVLGRDVTNAWLYVKFTSNIKDRETSCWIASKLLDLR